MTIARREIVDVSVTRWYHCISRCVRGGFLMGEGYAERKQWVEDRLQLLASNFAVSVGGFAIMDNHLHVLCRLDSDEADRWSAEDVVLRWIAIYPPRLIATDNPQIVKAYVAQQVKDPKRIEVLRERLKNLGWFMKALKEPLSRLANKMDGCRGAFWEARYKSIAILDTEALLATCVYIDLNPVAAGIAEVPEKSNHTSIKQRVDHVRRQGKLSTLKAAQQGSVLGSKAEGLVEQDHWLVPLQDRRPHTHAIPCSSREGMLDSFSLGSYLLLLDYTGRLFRNEKARISQATEDIMKRLGSSSEWWTERLQMMLKSKALRGSFFASQASHIHDLAARRGKRVANLTPQIAG